MRSLLEEIVERLPDDFNMMELLARAEERTPYQVVALQECERMNFLTQEMRRTLRELALGLKVSGWPSDRGPSSNTSHGITTRRTLRARTRVCSVFN